jgi:exopolyphosphatase/guanosine-5'-triphosphate,3'-diphosphate pyrophosphatase
MRRAAIDIGTNSVRLLVADVAAGASPGGPIVRPVDRRLTITRLGEALHAGGLLTPEAAARTAAAAEAYVGRARELGAAASLVAGTYAVRAARNPEMLLGLLSMPVRILSGEEEAALGFHGVILGLPDLAPDARVAVLDVGGGSVEVTWGTERGGIEGASSLPVGCVVMTRRAIAHDPPQRAEIRALAETLAAALDPVLTPLRPRVDRLIGVGGTVTTLAAMDQRLVPYDPDRVHGYDVTAAAVRRLLDAMGRVPLAERRLLPGLQRERADVIIAGALVVRHVLAALHRDVITASESDLLWALLVETRNAVPP